MDMMDLVAGFSSRNDNKFNDTLLLETRQKDEMTEYIDEACKAVVQLIPEYVKYIGYRYRDNRDKMLERDKDDGGDKPVGKERRIHISDTYAKEAVFEFECSYGGQVVRESFSLWIPMLIDNAHFYIRGNKYSCPLQIIDAFTFTKKNVLVLKTLTRAIKYERMKSVITDIYGNKYNTSKIMIYINRKAVSVLLYYFASFGFFKTLKYFGVEDLVSVYSDDGDSSNIPTDKIIFKFGSKTFIGVDKVEFNKNSTLRTFIATILTCQKRTMDMNYIRNPVRWTALLGETLSIQKPLEKGNALLKTFNNSYDHQTNRILNQLVPGTERTNIFEVTRWIFSNYAVLTSKDDGLQNKRLRLAEYLISPFNKVFIDKVYRFMNTPDKLKTINNLLDVFKIRSSLIINAIIGKISTQTTGLNIAKFSNEANDDSLVNTLLTLTKCGPGSPSEKSKRLSVAHRQFSIDFLGAISLIEGQSAGAPGLSHYICPLNDTFDIEKKIFTVDPWMKRV